MCLVHNVCLTFIIYHEKRLELSKDIYFLSVFIQKYRCSKVTEYNINPDPNNSPSNSGKEVPVYSHEPEQAQWQVLKQMPEKGPLLNVNVIVKSQEQSQV